MEIEFTEAAHKDFLWWKRKNPTKYERIRRLCHEILHAPFEGIGKPEPLKFDMQGCWSRRIDRTHRLVYQMLNKKIIVISCKYHY